MTDAMMLGIDPQTLRPRMAEALDVILRLLTSVEPLTYSGEWFSLREAVLATTLPSPTSRWPWPAPPRRRG